MARSRPIEVTAVVERKQADLPRFVVIPAQAIAEWALTGTTAVDVLFNDVPVARRNIKWWDADRWFFSVTQVDCRLLGVDTGATLRIRLSVVAQELPGYVAKLVEAE